MFRHLISAILLLVAIPLQAQVHIDDDFESYTPGLEPGGEWETSVNGEASILVVTNVSNSPEQSIQLLQTGDNGTGWLTRYHEPQAGRVTYSAFIRTNNVTAETITMSAREGGWPPGPWIAIGYHPGWISYYGGGWHDIVPASNDQWYHVKLEVDVLTHSYDIYIDDMDTPKVTAASFWYTDISYLESIRFEVYQTGGVDPDAGDAAWVDDVRVESSNASNALVSGHWELSFEGAGCTWSGTMTLEQNVASGVVNGSGDITVASGDSCSDLTGRVGGIVEGTTVRLLFPEGQTQEALMEGTVQGRRMTGTWSATGGALSGTWSAIRPGGAEATAIPVLPPAGLALLAVGLILLAFRKRIL